MVALTLIPDYLLNVHFSTTMFVMLKTCYIYKELNNYNKECTETYSCSLCRWYLVLTTVLVMVGWASLILMLNSPTLPVLIRACILGGLWVTTTRLSYSWTMFQIPSSTLEEQATNQ